MNKQILRQVVKIAIAICICGNGARAEESYRLTRPGAASSSPSSTLQTGSVSKTEDAGPIGVPEVPAGGSGKDMSGGASATGAMSGGAEKSGSAPLKISVEKNTTAVRLSPVELATLGQHDIVLCIDKSSSMSTMDCPSPSHPGYAISRWQWCGEQTMDLAQQASSVLPEGLSVVLFSWLPRAFPHVDMRQIPMIFMTNAPGGITNTGAALEMSLADYFQRREASHDKVRPLLIAVITDGLPTNPMDVKRVLVQATQMMKRPNEIHCTILQIGQDPEGVSFARELDHDLLANGAKYDVVSSETFDRLLKTGLAKALVDCVSEQQK